MRDDAITLSLREITEARDEMDVLGGGIFNRCFLDYTREKCEMPGESGKICRLCKRLTQFIGGGVHELRRQDLLPHPRR